MKKISIYMMAFGLLALLAVQACRKKDDVKPVAQLSISGYYPNSGNAGTLVTITGTGFEPDARVSFGDTEAEILNQNDTSVVVRAPREGQSGKISFAGGDKTMEVGNYTYQDLSVSGFFPLNGPAGMHVRISGTGFSSLNSPAEVFFNEKSAIVVSASDTLIVAEVPVDAGAGPIRVSVNGKSSTGAGFRFQSIASIKPLTGGAGTRVTINGSGFEPVTTGNIVAFNGKRGEVVEATTEKLVVVAPSDVATGPVTVTVAEQLTAGPGFTVVPKPTLSTVSPLSGPAGVEMTISGNVFSTIPDENVVKINGTVVPVKTATATRLTLVLPGGTGNGKVEVIVNDQLVTGPDFRDQNLGITTVTPSSGLGGTKVTIQGVGFSTVTSENIVTFNGTPAVIESATENTIVVTAPVTLSSGALKVQRAALEAQAPMPFNRAGVMTLVGGPGTDILSTSLSRIQVDSRGNVFASDSRRGQIWKVTPDGQAALYAGSPTGQLGLVNGPAATALLGTITGMAIDAQDNIFISEYGTGNSIRKITADGVVSTYRSGFDRPGNLGIDKDGNLYITQTWYGMVKVYPSGNTEQVVRGTTSDLCRPAIDAEGNIYTAFDDYEATVNKFVKATGINNSPWIGSSMGYQDGPRTQAQLSYGISGLVLDQEGNLVILDKSNFAIRKYDPASHEVSTLARFTNGYKDGSLSDAQVAGNVQDIAIDRDGNLYILDINNRAIRKIFLK